MSEIESKHCTSADEMLEYLRPSATHWIDEGGVNRYVYRGAWNSAWPLLPSAWRDKPPPFFVVVRSALAQHEGRAWKHHVTNVRTAQWLVRKLCENDRELILPLVLHLAAELDCVRRFADLANELGLVLPDHDLPETSDFLFGSRRLSRVVLVASHGPFPDMQPIHGLAQHHGIPTRLLDWSYHPLKAAYFAVAAEARMNAADEGQPSDNLAVWALNLNRLHGHRTKDDLTVYSLTVPRHSNSYLHAQDGLFTWIDGADCYRLEYGKWPCLFDVISQEIRANRLPKSTLRKCTLPTTEADTLLTKLWQERISRAHLMPTFDNVRLGLADYLAATRAKH